MRKKPALTGMIEQARGRQRKRSWTGYQLQRNSNEIMKICQERNEHRQRQSMTRHSDRIFDHRSIPI